MDILNQLAIELSISKKQVDTVINLLGEGSTIPFIARYRKEQTGGLDEDVLREVEYRHSYLSILESRKETVIKSIEEQGKLTEDLKKKILAAVKLQEVEDLYLPYRPKRKTRATVAIARGLEPLADFILDNPDYKGNLEDEAVKYIDPEKGVNSVDEAIGGAKDIIAERISESAEVRSGIRELLSEESLIRSEKTSGRTESKDKKIKDVYEIYYDFKIEIRNIKPYQTLALNRGEREKFLKVSMEIDPDRIFAKIRGVYFNNKKSTFDEMLDEVIKDSFSRLIFPSLEREVRKSLTETADVHAIEVFASNLRQLLLQPPISNKIIMGIDPGYVSGSKLAVIDGTGKYLEGKTIYPHPPQSRTEDSKRTILELIGKHNVNLIAIGNGTASRETEQLIAGIIRDEKLDCHYIIVNEAGASVYSASATAKDEFPDLEASMRGNISIARRVLDPLAELVKIDPKSIGVGLYQHDVDQKLLMKKLDDVVVSCVNYVGVDLNTASASLLTYVSGLNKKLAKSIVSFREMKGIFRERSELIDVPGIGQKSFEQSIGFLKIPNSKNPLDNTFIHPESYFAVEKLLELSNITSLEINSKGSLVELYVKNNRPEKVSELLNIGLPTLNDIIFNLKKPGRDPREEMPKPILRSDVLNMEDLRTGMTLKGTVRNVVDFGAFVDIGVKQDGLIHISQMADKFVKSPLEIVSVGDIVNVEILNVDIEKGRISLKLIR